VWAPHSRILAGFGEEPFTINSRIFDNRRRQRGAAGFIGTNLLTTQGRAGRYAVKKVAK
jgi:hypothetical protein